MGGWVGGFGDAVGGWVSMGGKMGAKDVVL